MGNILIHTAQAKVDAEVFGKVLDPIITHIVTPVVMLIFSVAIVVFVYGVLQVVWGGEEAREKGKKSMMGGIIGMFIMLSAWGIIWLVANTIDAL
ncbi:MAG: hypothetical protein M3Q80_03060 [bacterium]|nr:hypothetical protein [bacterium]